MGHGSSQRRCGAGQACCGVCLAVQICASSESSVRARRPRSTDGVAPLAHRSPGTQTRYSAMKLVHAADIHLDSPMRGLARYDGAPVEQLRLATRVALANLVDLALE